MNSIVYFIIYVYLSGFSIEIYSIIYSRKYTTFSFSSHFIVLTTLTQLFIGSSVRDIPLLHFFASFNKTHPINIILKCFTKTLPQPQHLTFLLFLNVDEKKSYLVIQGIDFSSHKPHTVFITKLILLFISNIARLSFSSMYILGIS